MCQPINPKRLASLPVAEEKQEIRAVLFRGQVRCVCQVISHVQLHVREGGHFTLPRRLACRA